MIRFEVKDNEGTLTVNKFEEAYDAYCRLVHCAVLNPKRHPQGRLYCDNPDGIHTLFCFVDGEFKAFVPCMDCKYLKDCPRKGDPLKEYEPESEPIMVRCVIE